VPSYDKTKINNLCDRYCKTEDPADFGELLMALKPMIVGIVSKWSTLYRHREDAVQEILLTLWRKQGHADNINKLKLRRMKRKENGDRICMSVYFYFVIRGYLGKVAPRIERIFERDQAYSAWFFDAEKWMANMGDVEAYRRHDESHAYMEKLLKEGE